MGFFSKIGKTLKKVLGAVAAVAAAVFIPGAGAFIGKALLGAAISYGASKLLSKRAETPSPAGGEGGGRVPLNPSTDNKLPVVYGSAWIAGAIFDAKISQDQKYMWYALSLCEKPDSTTVSFDTSNGVYYDGKLVQFGSNGSVSALITNNGGFGTAQSDNRMAGKIFIWLFEDGANNAGVNTGGQTAIQIMSDSSTGGGIFPSETRWNGSIFTSDGESVQLNDMAFAIIRVEFNPDAGTTGLGSLQVKVTNNLGASYGAEPGDAILDYMTNTRYGCALPLDSIDTTSLTNLNTYSNQSIDYIDVDGNPQTQPYRYRINGAVTTSATCLDNLQTLVDSCDSWLQYSEGSGKWRVVMNAPYSGSLANLFHVNATNTNSCNVIGGIQINPVDLNETYNQVEVAYPNYNVKDQTDYQIIDLTNPANWSNQNFDDVLSPNEAVNRLNISLPLVNSAVQAKYLAARRLLQSREDMVISCDLDYSGIQIEAGDVVRVSHETYGWDVLNGNLGKLFRVSSVNEQVLEDGSLVASIEAFEYNDSVYADNAITDFIPEENTGLSDPNAITAPCPPTITEFTDANALITGFKVESCVPEQGTVLYMDFNYGTTNVVTTHQLYRTVQSAGGIPFTNSPDIANANVTTISIDVNDLPAANYYWSTTARNDQAGRYSDGSNLFTWTGANIQPYDSNTGNGGLNGNQYRPNSVSFTTIGNSVAALNLIGAQGWSVASGNTTQTIENLANLSFANTGVPVYLQGTTVGANYVYPFAQGTSTTANGYYANSTAAFAPGNSAYISIQNGDNDWYAFTGAGFIANVLSNVQYLRTELRMQIITDSPTTIQLLPVNAEYVSNVYNFLGDTQSMSSHDLLVPNQPYYISTAWETVPVGYDADTGAILIKNIDANANITIVSSQINFYRGKN